MTTSRSVRLDPVHLVDVLVYLVVLNLAVQLVPSVISETFAASLVTATLLKVVLELVVRAKVWALGHVRARSRARTVLGVAVLVVLLPGSKLLVLYLVDVLLGDAVDLGGFWPVTALVVVLMLSRAGVRRLLVG